MPTSSTKGVKKGIPKKTTGPPGRTVTTTTASASVPDATNKAAIQKKDLARFFECPVCFDHALPPIYQCESGHLFCSDCRPKLTCCPTCRGPLGNTRNFAMEEIAQTVSFPCKNASNGCASLVFHTEKAEHEDNCEYRLYTCPLLYSSCKWSGSLDHALPHLMSCHERIVLYGKSITFLVTNIDLPGTVHWVMIQSCFGEHFLLVLDKENRGGVEHFYGVVKLIGSKIQSEKYTYRMMLECGTKYLSWGDTPLSLNDGDAALMPKFDCFSFDHDTAQYLLPIALRYF